MSYVTFEEMQSYGYIGTEANYLIASKVVESYINAVCNNIFEEYETTLYLDGKNMFTLFLPFSIIEINKVQILIDNQLTDIDQNDYVIYPGNDLRIGINPRISFKNRETVFPLGARNIIIEGKFGCCEYDSIESVYNTPVLIKYVTQKLIFEKTNSLNGDYDMSKYITKETTDGHSYEISNDAVKSLISTKSSVINNEAAEILELYSRDSIGIGAI